jgi:hypothetical protein
MTKISRNEACPCGSRKKYKHCCGAFGSTPQSLTRLDIERSARETLRSMAAADAVRKKQQGLGKPVIAIKSNGYQIVASGMDVHFSKDWKVFSDFLRNFIRKKLNPAWGKEEIAKPLAQRHPIMQWYDSFCYYQRRYTEKGPDGLYCGPMAGVAACYLGLAYGLYLLENNAELQTRMIKRLKDAGQFQGAYYELIIMSCMIRAGFKDIALEDETKGDIARGEFTATYEETGERVWVEAKARGVAGVLGRTVFDGTTRSDPTSSLTQQLNSALKKPTDLRRFVFLDLNAPSVANEDDPQWVYSALKKLRKKATACQHGEAAYVFVTNFNFHLHLDDEDLERAVMPFGLGIPDFITDEPLRLPEHYRRKEKHRAAYGVIKAIMSYPQLPDTFDGRPFSHNFGSTPPIKVGSPLEFPHPDGSPAQGTVEQVIVKEGEASAYALVRNGSKQLLVPVPLSPQEMADYRRYGSAYFGEPVERNHVSKDIHDHYEFLVKTHKGYQRANLMRHVQNHPDYARFASLSDDDFVLEYCEILATNTYMRGGHKEKGVRVVTEEATA